MPRYLFAKIPSIGNFQKQIQNTKYYSYHVQVRYWNSRSVKATFFKQSAFRNILPFKNLHAIILPTHFYI